MATSIFGMVYDELDAMKKHNAKEFKQFAKAFDALDREAIAGLILDGNIYWFEFSIYGNSATDEEYEQLHKYLKRKGYKYLHDIPDKRQ